jgi:alpha-galactosidase
MNRNYFVADPDAFNASTQVVEDRAWHGGTKPLSADEGMVSVVLSAVSGGIRNRIELTAALICEVAVSM